MRSRFAVLLPVCLCALLPVQAQTYRLGWSSVINFGSSESGKVTAVDRNGDVWVAGQSATVLEDFPGPVDPIQHVVRGRNDVFIAKYRPQPDGGAQLLYFTWLGGTGEDDVRALKIDANGRAILAGTTDSTDFTTAGNATQTTNGGAIDAWYAVVDPNLPGTEALVLSSFYGGTQNEYPNDIAIAADGGFVIVGVTTSDDLPGVSNAIQNNSRGGWDAFLIGVNASTDTSLRYASYYGGDSTDVATSAAFDRNGHLWITGYTVSPNFPVTDGAFQTTISTSYDAFVAKFDFSLPGLDALVYSTFYGGNGDDRGVKIEFDAAGILWVAAQTSSSDLPVTGDAVQYTFGGGDDGYILGLDTANLQAVRYGSYFGGEGYDIVYGFAVLPNGRAALTGYTMFGGLPTAGTPYQPVPGSLFADSFFSVLNLTVAGADGIEYSTYLGGDYTDVGLSMASDGAGGAVVTGYTNSYGFPTTDGSRRFNPIVTPSAFVYRFSRNVS